MTLRHRVADGATEIAFGAAWRTVRGMPETTAAGTFDMIADRAWRRRGAGVRQLERNLRRVLPEISEAELRDLSRVATRSSMRYWQEAFRLPSWSRERILETFDLDRRYLLDDAAAAGDGVIMVPGHQANWDHAGAWGALRYGRVVTVAERLRPVGVFEQFLAYRRSLGMEVLGTGDPSVMRVLARRLKEGHVVALLGDRDITRNGVEVELLGHPAPLPAGPAMLAILTGAPLLPVSMWFTERGSHGYVHDPVAVPRGLPRAEQVRHMVQAIADALGAGIRERPQDWHMMQPVWAADLPRPPSAGQVLE